MSKEKETDAATVLSQMSQLVGVTPTFDFSPSQDTILEADAIGATCTLQPSSLDNDILFPLSSQHNCLVGAKKAQDDPYIGFDDAEHPYAANIVVTDTSFAPPQKKDSSPSFHHVTTPPPQISTVQPTVIRKRGGSLQCTVCRKTFKTHSNLVTHMRFHSGEKPFACHLCNKPFTTKSDLKRHMKIHSIDNKSYKCDVCGKSFRDSATRTRHYKIHNPASSTLKCQHCEKTFTRRDSLKNHMKTHLEEKPFKCPVCSSEFAYRSSFNRHLAAHDTSSMFICDICGKAFNRSDYVESHKKQVHSSAPQQLNLSSTCVAFDVNEMHSQDDVPGMSKVKKGKKKRKKTSSEDENLNAVPILMSMAEQAAKPKTLSLLKEATTLMETDLLPQEEVTEDLPSPSNLGNEIINLIGESSDEDAPFTDDDTGSDRLEFFSDSEFQE